MSTHTTKPIRLVFYFTLVRRVPINGNVQAGLAERRRDTIMSHLAHETYLTKNFVWIFFTIVSFACSVLILHRPIPIFGFCPRPPIENILLGREKLLLTKLRIPDDGIVCCLAFRVFQTFALAAKNQSLKQQTKRFTGNRTKNRGKRVRVKNGSRRSKDRSNAFRILMELISLFCFLLLVVRQIHLANIFNWDKRFRSSRIAVAQCEKPFVRRHSVHVLFRKSSDN